MNILSLEQMQQLQSKHMYEGTFMQPFNMAVVLQCYNVWKQEKYQDIIITKAYKLYESYTRKGTELVGKGNCLGVLIFFSGKAYRGMGALGCTCKRARGTGLLLQMNNMMANIMLSKGLNDKIKPVRFKGLTGNGYKLVCNVKQTTNTSSNYNSFRLNIGLLGDDNSFIDLSGSWSDCMTLDLKDGSN